MKISNIWHAFTEQSRYHPLLMLGDWATGFTFAEKNYISKWNAKEIANDRKPTKTQWIWFLYLQILLPLKICRKHSYFASSKHYKAYLYIYVIFFLAENNYCSMCLWSHQETTLFTTHAGLVKSAQASECLIEGEILPSLDLDWYTLHTNDNY